MSKSIQATLGPRLGIVRQHREPHRERAEKGDNILGLAPGESEVCKDIDLEQAGAW